MYCHYFFFFFLFWSLLGWNINIFRLMCFCILQNYCVFETSKEQKSTRATAPGEKVLKAARLQLLKSFFTTWSVKKQEIWKLISLLFFYVSFLFLHRIKQVKKNEFRGPQKKTKGKKSIMENLHSLIKHLTRGPAPHLNRIPFTLKLTCLQIPQQRPLQVLKISTLKLTCLQRPQQRPLNVLKISTLKSRRNECCSLDTTNVPI